MTRTAPSANQRPAGAALGLEGLRVADLSIVTAGAGATVILADFGADVIKVEGIDRPDLFRGWNSGDSGYTDDLVAASFRTVNRNKRGIAIDLKKSEGLAVMRRLVASSDVVVENFRRGAIERLGLGFDELVKLRKDIVLVSVSSQGATGPNQSYRSFGSTLDALGGVMSITGYDADNPLWSSNRINYPDQAVSMLAPALIIAGVISARDTGRARWIDLSQRETVTALLGEWILMTSLGAAEPAPLGNNGPESFDWCTPCTGEDNWVAITLEDDEDWRRCALVVGCSDSDMQDPVTRGDKLRRAAERWSADRSREEVADVLQSAGLAAAAVRRGPELVGDPFLRDRGWWNTVDLPSGGTELQRGWVVRFAGTNPARIVKRAPRIGEQTEEILGELGYEADQIANLIANRVVGSVDSSTRR